jgi:hypothetical protein
MNQRKSIFNIVFLLLFCQLLLSCSTKQEPTSIPQETPVLIESATPIPTLISSTKAIIGDGGLLSEKSCKPPCFWGITPGVTLESETWEILKAKEINDACQPWQNSERGIQCNWKNGILAIGLGSDYDGITFIAFGLDASVKINQVIEKYGEPTGITVWRSGIPEYPKVGLTMFYDTITTRLDFMTQDGSVYDLRPDAEVIDVSYFNPEEYPDYVQIFEGELYTWNGYGEYEIR